MTDNIINQITVGDNYKCSYFNKFNRTHKISEIWYLYKRFNIYLLSSKYKIFFISGRVFRKRIMGKSMFLDIKDMSNKIQLYLSKNNFQEYYKNLTSYINLGDIIGVSGYLFKTKTNELSLNVIDLKILAKNIKTFPDKMLGLLDKETCYRERYLDLMVNENTQKIFILRSKIIQKLREFFITRDFLEVETPIIQLCPGGADAQPFKSYHHYSNSEIYFRISPELYLKRLIVGGLEKVFEIGKVFRNEGMSTRHHPEFTTIEFYEAYKNYKDLMNMTENLFKFLVNSIFSNDTFEYNNILFNFSKKFNRINFLDSIVEHTNLTKKNLENKKLLHQILLENNNDISYDTDIFDLQFKLFEIFVEKKLIQPTFILHHPTSISPLARNMDNNDNFVERFELYIAGKEIANGFSELNDPHEQKKRFLKQLNSVNNINKSYDDDFVNALKYGLPPTAGEGIGIDRLIMLFTNASSIKDTILFPLMKKKINYI